jgi:hypothetical protein
MLLVRSELDDSISLIVYSCVETIVSSILLAKIYGGYLAFIQQAVGLSGFVQFCTVLGNCLLRWQVAQAQCPPLSSPTRVVPVVHFLVVSF